jgi:transcriptional regulatory protein RtcR
LGVDHECSPLCIQLVNVIGFLGTQLDSGNPGAGRWEKWRPTVSLVQHEDVVIDRLELLYTRRTASWRTRCDATSPPPRPRPR